MLNTELIDIIKGCVANSRKEQHILYTNYHGYVQSIVWRYVQNLEMVKELINSCFLKVFQNIEQYDVSREFKPWLKRVVINALIDELRKKESQQFQFNEIEEIHEVEANYQVEFELELKDLLHFLHGLPKMEQLVFNLFVVDGFKHAEIAEITQMSVRNSKRYLANARTLMQEKVKMHELKNERYD